MKPRRPPVAPRKPTQFRPENVLATEAALRRIAREREFVQYHFADCNLSGVSLANRRLEDCLFERCNLTTASLSGTALQNVAFVDCKLLGVSFVGCPDLLFAVHFEQCQLRYASFGGKRLAGTRFVKCALPEADFTNADLTGALFEECDLTRTIFHDSRLTDADFSTATGFSIDPEANVLTGARFALAGLPGLLDKYGLVVV